MANASGDGAVVGTGAYRFRVVPGWGAGSGGRGPGGVLPGCGADGGGRVYVSRRSPPAILVFSSAGRLLGEWGGEVLSNPHSVTVAGGHVWVTDTQDHTARKFSLDGKLVLTLGRPGGTGAPGAPFNRPTGVWVAPGGELYVSDGYGQARVHRFSPEGTLLGSWGEAGHGPGQFTLPHHVSGDGKGTIYVCDRESKRVQLFDLKGGYLDELSDAFWPGLLWPNMACVDPTGALVVAEAGHRVSIWRRTTEPIRSLIKTPGSRWQLLARWGDVGSEPGQFLDCPHGLCLDTAGNIYVTEVPDTPDRITKFERV
jgi:sugar lactone lactonase YvrE